MDNPVKWRISTRKTDALTGCAYYEPNTAQVATSQPKRPPPLPALLSVVLNDICIVCYVFTLFAISINTIGVGRGVGRCAPFAFPVVRRTRAIMKNRTRGQHYLRCGTNRRVTSRMECQALSNKRTKQRKGSAPQLMPKKSIVKRAITSSHTATPPSCVHAICIHVFYQIY